MEREEINDWKRRADVFLKEDIPAHITTKNDSWFNGYIVSVYDDYIVLVDRKMGKRAIFFVDMVKFDYFLGNVNTLKQLCYGRKEDDTTNEY